MQGLIVRNLWFKYPRSKEFVLRGLSMDAGPGEVVLILGRNGSGKSTLLKVLAGVLEPSEGEVLIDGVKASKAVGKLTGMALQNPIHQFSFITVLEEVSAPLRIRFAGDVDREALRLLRRFGLEGLAWRSPYTLSSGEARLLTVAAAVAGRPRLVLLDEPFSGIDPHQASLIAGVVSEAASLGSVVIITSLLAARGVVEGLLSPSQRYVLEGGRLTCS